MDKKLKTETLYTRFPGCSPREVVHADIARKLLEALEESHTYIHSLECQILPHDGVDQNEMYKRRVEAIATATEES